LGGRGRRISEFEVSLVYKVSSRIAKATEKNPVSKKKKNPQNNNNNNHLGPERDREEGNQDQDTPFSEHIR
jgi:hypothetical protein